MHILMIEDDIDLGLALQRALKVDGISSEWIRRAADIAYALSGHNYDCLLLDLCLPDADGMDLLRNWRRTGMHMPVIVITAKAMLEDRLAGLDSGADDFIVKPFATAELVSRVRAVVRRYARQAGEI